MKKLYVVGIGPGSRENMTERAVDALRDSELIVAYKPYIDMLGDLSAGKEIISTGMGEEIERCKKAIESALSGKTTSIVSTGDAGVYAMAGPILEIAPPELEVEVIPGVSAQLSAAAELGAPIMHDFATVSLSDLMTPWGLILKRLRLAAEGDFVISLYNPRSKGREHYLSEALDIIREYRGPQTPVGMVKNSGRENTEILLCKLNDVDCTFADMSTVIIVGNSSTRVINGKMVTPRGYEIK